MNPCFEKLLKIYVPQFKICKGLKKLKYWKKNFWAFFENLDFNRSVCASSLFQKQNLKVHKRCVAIYWGNITNLGTGPTEIKKKSIKYTII